ncbi:hypothetical protein [Streptomyces sp. NPDC093097]|uniref:hypothetical protein n=1 Tax=Streptomyces sp. NPDC093097 TaxID=3366027 RepID=UPI00380D81FD
MLSSAVPGRVPPAADGTTTTLAATAPPRKGAAPAQRPYGAPLPAAGRHRRRPGAERAGGPPGQGRPGPP